MSQGSKSKTLRSKKGYDSSKKNELKKCAEGTLGSGNFKLAVELPEGEDINEWIAVNTVDFFNQINMLYGTITDFCTEKSCPVMNAGPKYEYHWVEENSKKSRKVSAPVYIDHLMTWVQKQLDDETIFPSKIDEPFCDDFFDIIRTIFKRLFRVYAHIYHSHYRVIVQELGEVAHLNASFKHFIYFVKEYKLIDKKELQPLAEVISLLHQKDSHSKKGGKSED